MPSTLPIIRVSWLLGKLRTGLSHLDVVSAGMWIGGQLVDAFSPAQPPFPINPSGTMVWGIWSVKYNCPEAAHESEGGVFCMMRDMG